MTRFWCRLFVVFLWMFVGDTSVIAAKRVALVIGNDAYTQVTKLQKATNDARSMGNTLEAIGFTVMRAENLTRRQMNRQLQLFTAQLDAGDEALFFFAGHGVEIAGRNYLLPTDVPTAKPGQEAFVTSEAIPVNYVLQSIRSRGTRVSILVLDACRDNPFPKAGTRSLGGTRGLARMPAPEGTFIMYSAGVGQTALDRLSDEDPHTNSVFTRSLLPLIKQPGLSLTATARQVRRVVQKLARTVEHDQRPAYYDEVTGDFFFTGQSKAQTVAQSHQPDELSALKARLKKMEQKLQKHDPKVAMVVPPNPARLSMSKNVPIQNCDRLAAHPYDPQKVTDGVSMTALASKKAITACRQAVNAHPKAVRFTYQLARALQKDGQIEEAIRLYREAIVNGHVGAMFSLSVLFTKGQGVDRDYFEGYRLARKAAELVHIGAMAVVAWHYVNGRGVEKDLRESVRWYTRAADAGDVVSMSKLGVIYARGLGVSKDDRQAVQWFRKAAEQENAEAMHSLAWRYASGTTVTKDEKEAVRLFRLAADKNHPRAMYSIGFMSEKGRGTAQNLTEAVRWYEKAAEHGEAKASHSLALKYERGAGVKKSYQEAARWYRKAVSQGSNDAAINLAILHQEGKGVPKDYGEAVRLFRKAAENGEPEAMIGLGDALLRGNGVKRSQAEGCDWFQKAARKGHLMGKHNLGVCYDRGWGFGLKPKEAARLILDAYRGGNAYTKTVLANGATFLSVDTRKAIQRLMKSFGEYSGSIDGKFGPGTNRALEALAK